MNCPSCKASVKEGETQCAQCGIILAKWKDSKQRAAEARLAALANESAAGLPKSLYLTLIAAVALPAMVIFVPDVGVPLRGGKLRYRLDKGHPIHHQADVRLTISSPQATLREDLQTTAIVGNEAREKDTGGNVTMRRVFEKFAFTPILTGHPELEKTDLSALENNWVMSPRGLIIETMVTVNSQMQSSAKNMQRLNAMRSDRMEYARQTTPAPVATTPSDAYESLLQSANGPQYSHLDQALFFQWPAERVKPGFSWQQQFTAFTPSPIISIEWKGEITYKLAEFKRIGNGYAAIIKWDSPMDASINGVTSAGSYKGTAVVDYSSGILRTLEAEIQSPSNGVNATLHIKRL